MSESTTVFRFSTQAYRAGDTISPGCYVSRKKAGDEGWIEEALENGRPDGAPSRDAAVYVVKSADQARYFGRAEHEGKGFVYEVAAGAIWWAVMCLPDALIKRGLGSPHQASIVGEYWRQQHQWRLLEGLCVDARVVAVLDPPDAIEEWAGSGGAMAAYASDRKQAAVLWP